MTLATRAALAAEVGVDARTLRDYFKRQDWPVGRYPPWTPGDVQTIQKWRRETLQEDRSGKGEPLAGPAVAAEGSPPGETVKSQIEAEKLRKLKLANDKEAGRLIEAEHLDGALGGLAAMVMDQAQQMPAPTAGRVAGKPVGQVEAELQQWVDSFCEALIGRAQIELVKVQDLVERFARRRGRGRPARGAK